MPQNFPLLLPRKGMETSGNPHIDISTSNRLSITASPQGDGNSKRVLHSTEVTTLNFPLLLPRKGMETKSNKLYVNILVLLSITASPQGDGNRMVLMTIHLFAQGFPLLLPRKGMETPMIVMPPEPCFTKLS